MLKIESEYDDLDKYNPYGYIIYYKKGTDIIHNPYGPAIIYDNGRRDYWIENQLHRLDGPARIWDDGYEEHFINNRYLTKEEFEYHSERLKYLGKEYLICLK